MGELSGAAGAAGPAAADAVPVDVPLEAVKTTLGVETPRVGTGVPLPVVGAPEVRHQSGDLLPTPTCSAAPRPTGRARWRPRPPTWSPAPPVRSSGPR
ncbi:hypothetical protein [Streptomyces sp. NPDC047718]|uniref:hypothetical protein n=1 Tax=Streptomyces sp. NPDC047718 TaxID=3155479 RepID=UPI0033FA2273